MKSLKKLLIKNLQKNQYKKNGLNYDKKKLKRMKSKKTIITIKKNAIKRIMTKLERLKNHGR
jgi:hypothetical protein